MNEQKLQILLKEINLISKEYKSIKKKDTFNIFKIIRKGHEEVGLHSRFLFELLSPYGSHQKKDIFLKLFIKQLKIDFKIDFDIVNAQVEIETENIDLFISNRSQAIIIENKIYAGDQPEQLSRYYEIIKDKNINDINIIYLTLDGKPPSDQSIIKIPQEVIDNRLHNISYSKFISPWLNLCLKECPTEPSLRETIVQYQKLLKQLTMSTEAEERKDLLSLLGNDNNMEQASYLVNNWIHMRWHTEMDFWIALQTSMPESLKQYKLINDFMFSPEHINGTVHARNNRDFEYGIAFTLFKYKEEEEVNNEEICFFILRGRQALEYGITIDYTKKKENFLIKKETDFQDYLIKKLPNGYTSHESSPWLHWKNTKKDINFEVFNSADTLALANPEKRTMIVKDLWEEITAYLNKVMLWSEIPILQEQKK